MAEADTAAERNDFLFPGQDRFSVFDGAQSQAAAGHDFQVSVEVLYAADDPLAFAHARTCAESDHIALFPAGNCGVGLVCIAPGGAAIDETLELPRNIGPVGGGYAKDTVCRLKLPYECRYIIVQYTFGGLMAGPAAAAVPEADLTM